MDNGYFHTQKVFFFVVFIFYECLFEPDDDVCQGATSQMVPQGALIKRAVVTVFANSVKQHLKL